ncbi:hypothetical protein E4U42_001927 [Claviceps africana]|uniref:Xylanolytic transcriptional activator regulatory domain-containing protein n=1 Tax=Claviceps africana TaxID=83212 RepID=A0A8K0J8V8_9HYPO|nr:hypothetical protein E4U42_001927 [Claviceps africana]
MASLRNIMNVDVEDDHVDSRSSKDSASKTSQNSDSSMVSSARGRCVDYPLDTSPSPNHGMNPSTRSIHALPIGQNTSAMPYNHLTSQSPSGRREKDASTDSTDSHHGSAHGRRHGHGRGHRQGHISNQPQTGSFPNVPSRPPGSQQETPVKLTPITGRVSRAKKGVPVHTCEMCRPHKVSNYAGSNIYQGRAFEICLVPYPVATKCFTDGTFLSGINIATNKKIVWQSLKALAKLEVHTIQEVEENPAILQVHRQSYDNASPAATTSGIPVSSGQYAPHTSTPAHLHQANVDFTMEGVKDEYMLDAVSHAQMATADFSQPRSMPAIPAIDFAQNICVPRAAAPTLSWPATAQATFPPPNMMETNARASEFSLSHTGWASIQQTTPRIMPGSMMVTSGGFSVPYTYGPPLAPSFTSIYNEEPPLDYSGYDGSPVLYGAQNPTPYINTPSPSFVPGRSFETMVTVPAPLPADRVVSNLTYRGDPIFRLGMQPQYILPVSLSREAQSALPTYMDIYWDKVHPLYPIIHRVTVEDGIDNVPEQVHVLCCAMAAVATQFLGHSEHRINGSLLHAYAWQKSKAFTQSARWSLPAMQCILLCEYYARFRGRHKDDHHPSSRFNDLYQMVSSAHHSALMPKFAGTKYQRWTAWIYLESCRRLLSACFLLSVHGMCYYEQPYSNVLGVDNTTTSRFHIPLSGSTTSLWEAINAEAWADMDMSSVELTTVGDVMQEEKASHIENPAFDVSLVIAAHALQLPTRKNRREVELVQDISGFRSSDLLMFRHFKHRPGATTYLALHYTPLHVLLAVSGDSWVFNRKIPDAKLFAAHQKTLRQWRDSGACAIATVFAARAIREFLSLSGDVGQAAPTTTTTTTTPHSVVICKDISDYWGLYVCTLICWAFGHPDKRSCAEEKLLPARTRATAWIQAVADMEPSQLRASCVKGESQAIVAFVREILDKDCLGGRNMLYADSVGVLRKLEEVDNWNWF